MIKNSMFNVYKKIGLVLVILILVIITSEVQKMQEHGLKHELLDIWCGQDKECRSQYE